jgi:hypothetical protein
MFVAFIVSFQLTLLFAAVITVQLDPHASARHHSGRFIAGRGD